MNQKSSDLLPSYQINTLNPSKNHFPPKIEKKKQKHANKNPNYSIPPKKH